MNFNRNLHPLYFLNNMLNSCSSYTIRTGFNEWKLSSMIFQWNLLMIIWSCYSRTFLALRHSLRLFVNDYLLCLLLLCRSPLLEIDYYYKCYNVECTSFQEKYVLINIHELSFPVNSFDSLKFIKKTLNIRRCSWNENLSYHYFEW